MAKTKPKTRPKTGRGRPAAEPKHPRNRRIQVVVSARDLKAIDGKRDSHTRSDWIYRLIRAKLKW